VGPVRPTDKENQVKMYKKYRYRLGSLPPYQIENMIRIRIKVKSRIRIRITRVWIAILGIGYEKLQFFLQNYPQKRLDLPHSTFSTGTFATSLVGLRNYVRV
jgi:hypothetical protein